MSSLTPAKIAEINEVIEAEAYANYFLCAPPEFSRPFRLEVKRFGSVCVTMIPGSDNIDSNRILGLGLSEPATESMLDKVIAPFQKAGCKNYKVQLCPITQPAQISDWLAERGFKPHRNMAKVYRGTEPVPAISTDLRVEMIGEDQADAYASVVLPVFGLRPAYRPLVKANVGKPGWHHCLAFAGEKPVAAAAMFMNNEVAWLGFGSTLRTHRRRGGESAVIARLIQEGLDIGCQWFVGETDEDTPEHPISSYHNTMRIGFKLAYLRRNYYHQPPMSHLEKVYRALFVAAYSLKFEWQRLLQQGNSG